MSIYSTGESIFVPTGKDRKRCRPYDGTHVDDGGEQYIEVTVQFVPPHIGHPDAGYPVDHYADFLPPIALKHNGQIQRAAVFITNQTKKGTRRSGQEYVNPLLVLSGPEYESLTWPDLYERLCLAVQQAEP